MCLAQLYHRNSYLFLLERAHIVRAPFLRRRIDDWVWVGGTLFIVFAFGALSIVCLLTPHSELSPVDDRCHIGAAAVPSYLLLAFDAFVNAALTIIFILLLKPLLQFKQLQTNRTESNSDRGRLRRGSENLVRLTTSWFGGGKQRREASFWKGVRKVLWKNTMGSALIFLASAANLTAIYVAKATQLGWLCLACCIADGESQQFSWSPWFPIICSQPLALHVRACLPM
jgi:hypothetical protein